MWIDSHCHLAHSRFQDDLDAVVDRAGQAGVEKVVVPATDLASAARALEMAERFDPLHVAVGVHPCDVDSLQGEAWVSRLDVLLNHPKAVAVGEIGLDFYHAPPAGWSSERWGNWQEHCLRLQLDLAAARQLPVILHQRQSMARLRAVMDQYHGRVRAVFHCFTGELEEALGLIALGHVVSFTGLVTFPMRWRQPREQQGEFELPAWVRDPDAPLPSSPAALAAVPALKSLMGLPAGSFMLETDAPYLAPGPFRGRRCEPAHLALTGQAAAMARGCEWPALARQTSDCAKQFFGLNSVKPTWDMPSGPG